MRRVPKARVVGSFDGLRAHNVATEPLGSGRHVPAARLRLRCEPARWAPVQHVLLLLLLHLLCLSGCSMCIQPLSAGPIMQQLTRSSFPRCRHRRRPPPRQPGPQVDCAGWPRRLLQPRLAGDRVLPVGRLPPSSFPAVACVHKWLLQAVLLPQAPQLQRNTFSSQHLAASGSCACGPLACRSAGSMTHFRHHDTCIHPPISPPPPPPPPTCAPRFQ
jgi:hypothetical protein